MSVLPHLNISNILFLDIETVPQNKSYKDLTETERPLWDHKAKSIKKKDESAKDSYQRAGIYAEFGKIVCISVGYMRNKSSGKREFRLRSFFGHDEKVLLEEFADILKFHFNKKQQLLCAHNGKEFDFPYIARRMIINSIPIPSILQISGLKPWEVRHIDTMELWKFGDWKSYTSISLLAHVLGIKTPKDDINGSDVARVYYEENDLDRIEVYCRKDTLTVAQVLLRLMGSPILTDDEIVELD